MQEDPLHDKNSVSERLLSTNYSPQPNVQYAPEFSHQGILGQIFTLTTIICTGLLIFVATIIGLTLYGIFGLAEVALGFISVTPTVVIFGLICFKVRHLVSVNRLAKFYLCGVIGVFPVMGIELGISALFNLSMKNVSQTTATAIVGSLFESFIVASLCEESIKLIIGLCARRGEKDIPYTISILCVAGALGLATLENLMYVYFTSFQSLLSAFVTSIMRAFLSVPLHASTAMIFGTEIAKMRFEMKHRLPFFFFVGFLIHGSYDSFTFLATTLVQATKESLYYLLYLGVIGSCCFGCFLAGFSMVRSYRKKSFVELNNI